MTFKSRKIFIWLSSLIAVVLVYVLISFFGGREPIKVETTVPEGIDSNTGSFEGEVGKIGTVGVVDINNPVYRHANEFGQIDREFGFKKLIRSIGDLWDVEKPFINFFRGSYNCYISADKGSLQMENVADQPEPKDASLSGNVVVHFVPKTKSSIKECFLYLDDIAFESDTSIASTPGPIRFVSEDIQLTGKGLEFVYDSAAERLEFLRIPNLGILKLKVKSQIPAFSSILTERSETAPDSTIQTSSASSRNERAEEAVSEPNVLTEQPSGKLYKWAFNKNVVIEDPRQLIFTDQLVINDIPLSEGSVGRIRKTDANHVTDENTGSILAGSGSVMPAGREPNKNVFSTAEENKAALETVEVVVKCDGGIFLTPMDSNMAIGKISSDFTVTGGRGLKEYGDPNGRGTFESRRIDYFLDSNTAVFTGDCSGTMFEPDKSLMRKYTLSAPRVEARMSNKDSNIPGATGGLEHIRADGGVVQAAVEVIEQAESLGFTKITGMALDYDVDGQIFTDTGPGMIAVNNSKMSRSEIEQSKDKTEQQAEGFSLKRPCWAIVENFDTFQYDLKLNQLSADSAKKKVNIGYMPIIDGEEGPVVKTSASHFDARFIKTDTGRMELLALKASGGVSYEQEPVKTKTGTKKPVQFVGSDLIYSLDKENKPAIKTWGNESWPCFLNGVLVDGIEYNLVDGTIKETKILGPGLIQ